MGSTDGDEHWIKWCKHVFFSFFFFLFLLGCLGFRFTWVPWLFLPLVTPLSLVSISSHGSGSAGQGLPSLVSLFIPIPFLSGHGLLHEAANLGGCLLPGQKILNVAMKKDSFSLQSVPNEMHDW